MKRWKLAGMAMALFLAGMLLTAGMSRQAAPALAQLGSSGEQVTKIQQRLAEFGYDVGEVDGVFGSKTKNAVIKFQKDNGLTADGVVGSQTLAALGLSGTAGSVTADSLDLDLLSRVISAEAKGEPYEGQVAVGAVILNRIEHPLLPQYAGRRDLSGRGLRVGVKRRISQGRNRELHPCGTRGHCRQRPFGRRHLFFQPRKDHQ